MLNRTREKFIDCMRKGWAKTDLSRNKIPDPESQFKLKSCLKQRNNWSTEAGEWQTSRTTKETREGYWCSHCMLQSAMQQHAFTVWEPRWVEKMKEMDRALWEEDAHIQWLERKRTYISTPKTLQQLYISFVTLHLDYAAGVWDFQLEAKWMCTKYWLAGNDSLLSSFNIPFLKKRCLYLKSLASEWSTCCSISYLGLTIFSWFFFWSKHIKSITSKAR